MYVGVPFSSIRLIQSVFSLKDDHTNVNNLFDNKPFFFLFELLYENRFGQKCELHEKWIVLLMPKKRRSEEKIKEREIGNVFFPGRSSSFNAYFSSLKKNLN